MEAEQRKRFLILGVLGVVLVGILYWFVIREDPEMASVRVASEQAGAPGPTVAPVLVAGPAPGTQANLKTVFVETDVEINALIQGIQEVTFVYANVHEPRDPMNPLVGSNAILYNPQIAQLTSERIDDNLLYEAQRKMVNGIIWDPDNPLAVIDDEVVGIGHQIHQYIFVKDILHDHVVLSIQVDNENLEIVRELKEP